MSCKNYRDYKPLKETSQTFMKNMNSGRHRNEMQPNPNLHNTSVGSQYQSQQEIKRNDKYGSPESSYTQIMQYKKENKSKLEIKHGMYSPKRMDNSDKGTISNSPSLKQKNRSQQKKSYLDLCTKSQKPNKNLDKSRSRTPNMMGKPPLYSTTKIIHKKTENHTYTPKANIEKKMELQNNVSEKRFPKHKKDHGNNLNQTPKYLSKKENIHIYDNSIESPVNNKYILNSFNNKNKITSGYSSNTNQSLENSKDYGIGNVVKKKDGLRKSKESVSSQNKSNNRKNKKINQLKCLTQSNDKENYTAVNKNNVTESSPQNAKNNFPMEMSPIYGHFYDQKYAEMMMYNYNMTGMHNPALYSNINPDPNPFFMDTFKTPEDAKNKFEEIMESTARLNEEEKSLQEKIQILQTEKDNLNYERQKMKSNYQLGVEKLRNIFEKKIVVQYSKTFINQICIISKKELLKYEKAKNYYKKKSKKKFMKAFINAHETIKYRFKLIRNFCKFLKPMIETKIHKEHALFLDEISIISQTKANKNILTSESFKKANTSRNLQQSDATKVNAINLNFNQQKKFQSKSSLHNSKNSKEFETSNSTYNKKNYGNNNITSSYSTRKKVGSENQSSKGSVQNGSRYSHRLNKVSNDFHPVECAIYNVEQKKVARHTENLTKPKRLKAANINQNKIIADNNFVKKRNDLPNLSKKLDFGNNYTNDIQIEENNMYYGQKWEDLGNLVHSSALHECSTKSEPHIQTKEHYYSKDTKNTMENSEHRYVQQHEPPALVSTKIKNLLESVKKKSTRDSLDSEGFFVYESEDYLYPKTQGMLDTFKRKRGFRLKAKCFEAFLQNIVTEYEEDIIREKKLRALKKYRIFKAFQEETLKHSFFKVSPVLRDLSDMLVEVRNINTKEKVFTILKNQKNLHRNPTKRGVIAPKRDLVKKNSRENLAEQPKFKWKG